MLTVKSHVRAVNYSVDAAAAKKLRDEGFTLAAIRDKIAPMASLPTISRAIARAEAEQSK
jgi:hypothetical protein